MPTECCHTLSLTPRGKIRMSSIPGGPSHLLCGGHRGRLYGCAVAAPRPIRVAVSVHPICSGGCPNAEPEKSARTAWVHHRKEVSLELGWYECGWLELGKVGRRVLTLLYIVERDTNHFGRPLASAQRRHGGVNPALPRDYAYTCSLLHVS